jgi:hypothetical protein
MAFSSGRAIFFGRTARGGPLGRRRRSSLALLSEAFKAKKRTQVTESCIGPVQMN